MVGRLAGTDKGDGMGKIGQRFKLKNLRVVKITAQQIGSNTTVNKDHNEVIISSFKPVNDFCEYFLVAILEDE